VLLHFCLTGRLPFAIERPEQLREAGRHRRPEPLPRIEGLPEEVTDLCHACLARDPAERPSSLVAALVLAEAVDARVYVPLAAPVVPRQRPAPVSAWTERAAAAATEAAMVGEDARH
jgi:serine/threonine-protein kinase